MGDPTDENDYVYLTLYRTKKKVLEKDTAFEWSDDDRHGIAHWEIILDAEHKFLYLFFPSE